MVREPGQSIADGVLESGINAVYFMSRTEDEPIANGSYGLEDELCV
jgi:hypothetical protein